MSRISDLIRRRKTITLNREELEDTIKTCELANIRQGTETLVVKDLMAARTNIVTQDIALAVEHGVDYVCMTRTNYELFQSDLDEALKWNHVLMEALAKLEVKLAQ